MTEIVQKVDGHSYCECGTLVLDFVFHSCGKQCMACFENTRFKTVRQIEVMNRGRRMNVKTSADKPKKKKYKPVGEAARQRHIVSQTARQRALRRLKNLYPEMYAILYAQERAKAGLNPVPMPGVSFDDVITTYEQSIAYPANDGVELP